MGAALGGAEECELETHAPTFWGREMSKADPPALVAAAFRRSPARNRYVDAERWPVFTREQLGADDRVMVEAEGMVESQEWHRAPGKADYYDAAPSARGERAILIQSASHIAQLCEQFPELKEGLEEAGAFGENLLCAGERMDARNVHVGDVFSVEGSTLLLQAASPRRPCGNVDLRHGKRFGQQGVRAYCARTGCGGTFFRVLRAGAVGQGSRLRLEYTHSAQRRSHWSMARLSEVLYGEADSRYRVPRWRGSRAELRALCAEPALAEVEWKAVLLELLPRELRADGVAPLLRGVALAVWAALVATTFRAPAVRPDWLAWCGRLLAGDWAGEEMGVGAIACSRLSLAGLSCSHNLRCAPAGGRVLHDGALAAADRAPVRRRARPPAGAVLPAAWRLPTPLRGPRLLRPRPGITPRLASFG